jgi:deoxyribodipyrimidine photolyase
MSILVWLHEDALRADHPAVVQAGDAAMLCYVWDDRHLRKMDYGFKRLVFIYETLCELPVTVYKGDTVSVLIEIARRTHAESVYIPATPNPELQALTRELAAHVQIQHIDDTPFVQFTKEPDSKRFFRYWNKAKKKIMQNAGETTKR